MALRVHGQSDLSSGILKKSSVSRSLRRRRTFPVRFVLVEFDAIDAKSISRTLNEEESPA